MRSVGMLPVVVHGGGPQIGALMERVGKVAEFQGGFRVTDADTIDLVRMVLVGKVNRDIVSTDQRPRGPGRRTVRRGRQPHHRRGPLRGTRLRGRRGPCRPGHRPPALAQGLIPVVATIGTDQSGQAFNINADTAAGALAAALEAEKLVFLTDVAGLRSVPDDPATLIHQATADDLDGLVASAARHRRHDPQGGVVRPRRPGRGGPGPHPRRSAPHALLLEIFTDEGVGTMVVRVSHPVTDGSDRHDPLGAHAHLRRAAGDLRPGRGEPALRHRGPRVPRLPVRPGRDLARPRPPGGGRGRGRAGPDPVPCVEPVRERRGPRGGRDPGPADRRRHRAGRRPGVLRQLGSRGQRVRPQAGPPVGRPGPLRVVSAPGTRSTAGPWPP